MTPSTLRPAFAGSDEISLEDSGAGGAAGPFIPDRFLPAGLAAFWIGVFVWVWIPAPGVVKVLSLAWAGLGLVAPNVWLVTLALALPWFGNNPGGPHHLYLLDLGLIGFVVRDLIERGLGRRSAQPSPFNTPITVFLWLSAVTLIPQWRFLNCELRASPRDFMFNIFIHYATAGVYGLRAWLNLALGVGLYRALRDASGRGIRAGVFIGALLAGGVFSAGIGLLEYVGWVWLEWWRPPNPNITRFGYQRLMSLFWHSGWFAQYLACVAPIALAVAFTVRSRAVRIGAIVTGCLMALAQVFTMQRGGWLAMMGGGGAVFALQALRVAPELRRRYFRWVVIGGILAVSLVGALAAVNEPLRRRMGEMLVVRDRALIWRGGINLIRSFPYGGVGIGNYSMAHRFIFDDTMEESKADDRTTAHQLFIHTAAERGIPAAALLGVILAAALIGLARGHLVATTESGQNFEPGLLRLAAWGGLIAALVDGMFQYTFYMRVTELLVWVWLGIAASGAMARGVPSAAFGRRWRAGFTVFGVAAGILFAVASSSYFAPYKFWQNGEGFLVGPERVDLAIPAGARKISIRLATFDPSIDRGQPLTVSCFVGDTFLGVHVFEKREPATLTFTLPAARKPGAALTIRAQRTWRPYIESWRSLPLDIAGVCYQPPVKVE